VSHHFASTIDTCDLATTDGTSSQEAAVGEGHYRRQEWASEAQKATSTRAAVPTADTTAISATHRQQDRDYSAGS